MQAMAMLDEEYDPLRPKPMTKNFYTHGSINAPDVVIACMPPDGPGRAFASKLVQPLSRSFPDRKLHCFVALRAVYNLLVRDGHESGTYIRDVVIG